MAADPRLQKLTWYCPECDVAIPLGPTALAAPDGTPTWDPERGVDPAALAEVIAHRSRHAESGGTMRGDEH